MAAHVASWMSMSATKAAAGTAAEVTATTAEMSTAAKMAATTSTVAASTALRECRRSAHGEHRRERDGNNELLE
jgi:hypothetical protein